MPGADQVLRVGGSKPRKVDVRVLADYASQGWARLGRVMNDEMLAGLRARVDDLMHGRLVYPGMFFQRDSETGSYDDLRFDYLDGPVKKCVVRNGATDPTSCPTTTTPLQNVVLPPGY